MRCLHGFDHSGELAVHVRFGAEAAHAFEPGLVRRGGITDVADVIDDDPQLRVSPCESDGPREITEPVDVQREAMVREQAEMAGEGRVGELGAQFARRDAYPSEERVGGEAAQISGKRAIGRSEIADEAHDAWMLVGQTQDPVVVLRPGARFDHHRLADAVRRGDPLPIGREHRAVEETVLGRPWYALTSGRVVEVRMGINDPGRGRPTCAADGDRGGAGRAGEGAQERTTVSQLGHAGDLCAKVQKCKGEIRGRGRDKGRGSRGREGARWHGDKWARGRHERHRGSEAQEEIVLDGRLIGTLVGKRGALSRMDCHRRMAVW